MRQQFLFDLECCFSVFLLSDSLAALTTQWIVNIGAPVAASVCAAFTGNVAWSSSRKNPRCNNRICLTDGADCVGHLRTIISFAARTVVAGGISTSTDLPVNAESTAPVIRNRLGTDMLNSLVCAGTATLDGSSSVKSDSKI